MRHPNGYNDIATVKASELTIEDLNTFEKVLKFCAEADGMAFSPGQAIQTLMQTSNVLRWKLGSNPRNLEYSSREFRRFVALDNMNNRLVIVECYGSPLSYRLEYLREVTKSDNNLPIVDEWCEDKK